MEFDRKPRKCPLCGKTPVASIKYGMVYVTEELREKIEAGRISLGGCIVMEGNPVWECTFCETPFYRSKKSSRR